ncbi:uncharacterized protein TRAVEDRAFT_166054 [Trametes versicolor FP-101664 SS1]|uniref:uncharacterized protein n=1 Tax=Trametes versicolor (strain FP-101664) TaxID=717944 RepID=UPI000462330E|nr:uncharacterized protein TRAVEDRAFT_166054 [Trametes versicolor FP-101664 SS1]EIW60945.1 hypothetical protein TRAVEDRAFT_166054 [Trametes versicolor FP-101664 SS1]
MSDSSDPSTRILDHIVHLSPPGRLQETVEAFRALGFTVSPGGTHADGLTANALVILADGVYLELIHFTRPPPPDSTHPWAAKQPGWVDFAHLGNAGTPSISATINARAEAEGSGVHYAQEIPGGRTREDGRVLKWLISGIEDAGLRGRLPFFCGDLTPRAWRVPLEPRSNTEHANTTIGVAHVKHLVAPEELPAYANQLTSVLGVSPKESTSTKVVWELEKQPSHRDAAAGAPVLIISAPQNEEEREYLRGRGSGVYELAFAVEDPEKEGVGSTPQGRVVWKSAGRS